MAILNSDLTEVQIGLEAAASPGTLVSPTGLVPVTEASYTRTQRRDPLDEMQGINADQDDVLVRQYSELQITQVLDVENIIPALSCAVEDATAVQADAATDPATWTYTPDVTQPQSLRTATINVISTDGGTEHRRSRFGNARPTALSIAIGEDGYGTIQTTWMGQAAVDLSTSPTVSKVDRTPLAVDSFAAYIDDTWAALGGTLIGGIRSLNIDIEPGLEQAYTKDGRANLDPAGWYRQRPRGVIAFTINQDSDGLAELGDFRTGQLRFVRLQASIGSAANLKRLRIDACVRYIETPDELARSERQHTLDFQGMFRADDTSAANYFEIEVSNGFTSW